MEPIYTGGLLITGAVVWVVCAIYAYRGAPKFGRRAAVWGALGIVFGPIALMILYILPKQGKSSSASGSSHKTTQADLYEVPKHK
jgi:multisubunit Na+/H+ antiporter MnhB subunit